MHPHQPPPGGAPYDPLLGQTIGNYVVKQKLGEGGMGSVYLAEHPAIGKKVALKVLHAEFAANQEVVSRFFNEARAVNDIQHPNIVDIVDYGVLAAGPAGDQMVYFIMEFLPGITLSELIRRESPLAPERSLSICLQVADALAASHIKGIIHRDLKPDNIILLQRGRERDFVKLLDFGIAKLTGDQPGSRRTRTGIVMGTPAYMSPEQCEGRGNIDHRTDIYALGIVLYEMITGRVPFVGEGYGEVLVQHLTQAPAAPSTIRGLIPPHVEQIVLKALEKQPQARYPTMEEMMRAMQDPVGYVEAHGGLAGFKNAVLTPSNAPLQAGGVRLTPTPTPSPLNPLTPLPGSVGAVAAPGTPTTLGASAGQVAPSTGGGKKIGIFVGIGVAVAAIAAAIVLLVGSGGGGGKKADDTKDEDTVANNDDTGDKGTDKGSDTEVKAGQDTGDKGTDKGSDTGSETATDNGGGKGSDTGSDTGTGTGTGTVTDNGGTTGTGTGSDTGTGTGTGTATDNGGTTGTGTGSDTGTGTGTGTGTVAPKAKIKITIDSSPSGAMVFVGTEKEPRGKTPYNFEVDEGPGTLEVKLFVKKYKWEKIKIPTDQGAQTLDVKLEKEKKSGGGGGHKTGGGDSGGDDSGSDDTMNPFKKKKP